MSWKQKYVLAKGMLSENGKAVRDLIDSHRKALGELKVMAES
jgi:hypothetical protein